MKAILVMEMPESCADCQLHIDVCCGTSIICSGCGCENMSPSTRPNWCPLVPMPERQKLSAARTMTDLGWIEGFNACINFIEYRKE